MPEEKRRAYIEESTNLSHLFKSEDLLLEENKGLILSAVKQYQPYTSMPANFYDKVWLEDMTNERDSPYKKFKNIMKRLNNQHEFDCFDDEIAF